MDRKNFHFNPNTATFEQSKVYDFFKQLTYAKPQTNGDFICYEATPELIVEEALFLRDLLSASDSFNEKNISSDLLPLLSVETAIEESPQKAKLPSLNLAFYTSTRTPTICLSSKTSVYVVIAMKMLMLQEEILSYSESDFCKTHKVSLTPGDVNAAKFHTLSVWLMDALQTNPRTKSLTEDKIWKLFNESIEYLEMGIDCLIRSAVRSIGQGSKSLGMYYFPTIQTIADSIVNKYSIANVDAFANAFSNALSYNKQYFDTTKLPEESCIYSLQKGGHISEKEYQQRIANLYTSIESLYDECIVRDREFLYSFIEYCKREPTYFRTILSIDLIINIRDIYLKIKEQRDILKLPDLLAKTPKARQVRHETPAELSAFEQMVNYARNRFKNEEMQTIVKMLMHVYHSDEKKYAIIEQIEPEWIELHTPKTTVTVENGASYNEIHDNKKVDLTKQS